MKKYKLIKKFPDGPELGQVAEYQEGNNNYYIKGEGFGTLHYRYSVRSVENNPEFWEEVKEKEWEIIVFKCTFDEEESFTRLKENGFYMSDDASEQFKRTHPGATLKYMLSDYNDDTSTAVIHSIKRLSDGEVFTIGDKVYETVTGKKDSWNIKEFSLKDERCFSCGININNIEKRIEKEPILTTEEGVGLYEGDQYWTVFTKASSEIKPFTLYGPHKLKPTQSGSFEEEDFNHTECLYFAQLNNATKYIQENKPKTVYGVNGSFTKTATSLANKTKDDFSAGDWKWFDTEKERDLYIEENKPRFSKKDMFSFIEYFYVHKEVVGIERVFGDWSNQVRKEK